MDPVRASYGPRSGISNDFHILWDPYGPVRDPQACRTAPLRACKGINTNRSCKNPARASHVAAKGPCGTRAGPERVVHVLFIISKPVRVPLTYNACIKTLRAPCGKAKFVRRHMGPVRAPWVDVRFLFKTAREQPGNNPYGARECDVTGA